MRILVVAGILYGRGGMETCLRMLAEQAAARGDEVHILALAPSQTSGAWHADLPYSEVPGSGSTRRQWTAGLASVTAMLRRFRPDIVFALFCGTLPLIRAAQVLVLNRAPLVAWLHFSFAVQQRIGFLRLAHKHLCINGEIAGEVRALPGIQAGDVAVVYNGTDVNVPFVSRPALDPLRIVYVGAL